ncbi:TonB-dependent receptor [Sphingomonas spermidinifaciens]|uniref:TonB-dependent receptor n=1 Tax=Sphingomonas spermidinifaciens TaxID=1141889 RepID=A0A2A4B8Y8_9SPHN|nr:carboxypeptidase regulatory-like domain-containing protein [Sphingomonas spermidinifaciens]PCD04547.1 TonB-dependent receptor [Sphingomonas spermidinifaciens]
MRNHLMMGAAAVALMIPAAAMAQETTSSIRGTVTQDGAPVAGAVVRVVNTTNGSATTANTNDAGSFVASGLLPGGPYTIEVTSSNGNATVTDIFTVVGQPYTVPVELAAAGGDDIVITASRVAGAGTIASGPRTVLTQADIGKVASVNRDVRDLARRDPLAQLDLSNSRAVSFGGVNPRFNRFTINGVQIGDSFGLNSDANPTARGPIPFDAIAQFSVSIAPSDIRQGNFQGGAIDTVVKSGTNEFTGTGFYSQSTDGLQGDTIGSNSQVLPKYKSETYGATIAGPLIRDKLFFMVSGERNTDPRPAAVSQISQIPGLTQAQIDTVKNIAQSTYNYEAGDIVQVNQNKDEKIVGRVDWNIVDGQRLSLTYINAYESGTVPQGTSTSLTTPSLGLSSNAYQRSVLLRSGIVQLNSDWTDKLSTEARFLYQSTEVTQESLGQQPFAQIRVCTDQTSIVSGTNTVNSCSTGAPVIAFGPDISRQANELFFDTWGGSLLTRYNAGAHQISLLAEYNRRRTTNLFLQNATGAYYFDSITDFQNRNASQFSYQNALSLNVNDAAADFVYEQWTFGLQDTWAVASNFDVTLGARYDLYGMRSQVPLNNAYLARYGFTNTQTYKGLDNFQPRFSFNWRPVDALRVRGGVSVFGGGSPDIYVSNSFSNTGVVSSAISNLTRATAAANGSTATCTSPFNTPANAPVCQAALNGVNGATIPAVIDGYIATNTAGQALAPTSSLAQDFRPPSVTKFNLTAEYDLFGFTFGADYLYTLTNEGVSFTDLRSRQIGTLPDGRPRYTFVATPGTSVTADNNADYLLYNDGRGRSHIAVARFAKDFDFGLSLAGSYAWQNVKDVSPATSSTPGSLYANAAKGDPNFPAYGRANDETTWRYTYSIGFDRAFFGDYRTVIQLFGETRAGRRYSFTMQDNNSNRSPVFGTIGNNNAHLLYVPTGIDDARVSYDNEQTRTDLEALINNTALKNYRGQIAAKNIARNRAFTRIDLHLEQEIPTFVGKSRISLFADIENLPNLINSEWGGLRQFGFPYTADVVRVQCLTTPVATGTAPGAGVVNTNSTQACNQYRYSSYREPNEKAVSFTNSLYLIRVGARFTF